MNFRVGQKVVCVDDSPTSGGFSVPLKNGVVYEVAAVDPTPERGGPAIRVCGVLGGGMLTGFFYVHRFRPAVERKTDISTFTKILDDVSAGRVREIVGV